MQTEMFGEREAVEKRVRLNAPPTDNFAASFGEGFCGLRACRANPRPGLRRSARFRAAKAGPRRVPRGATVLIHPGDAGSSPKARNEVWPKWLRRVNKTSRDISNVNVASGSVRRDIVRLPRGKTGGLTDGAPVSARRRRRRSIPAARDEWAKFTGELGSKRWSLLHY